MQREGILERVGEQEEADLLKEAHVRAVFAASDRPVSKEQMRDIRRKCPSEFDHRFG
jgi:uncharacterized protein (DUF2267 family)